MDANDALAWLKMRAEQYDSLEYMLSAAAESLWQEGYDLVADAAEFSGPQIMTAFGPVSIAALVASWKVDLQARNTPKKAAA